ncbi:unnamed protein product, partial [Heterotrigona itama]
SFALGVSSDVVLLYIASFNTKFVRQYQRHVHCNDQQIIKGENPSCWQDFPKQQSDGGQSGAKETRYGWNTAAIDREDGDWSVTSEYSESGVSASSAESSESLGGSSWSNSEKVVGARRRGGSLLTVASLCRVRGRRVGKSAPSSFRNRAACDKSGGEGAAKGDEGAQGGAGQAGGGQSSSSTTPGFARSVANGLKLAQTQAIAVAGFLTDVDSRHDRVCTSCLSHRASYHGRVSWAGEGNGSIGAERLSHSLPGSPADRKPNFEVIGSAESLVGRVLAEQGLGKYCDPDFVKYTSREMQEALDMTREEMDRAAHQLLLQERHGQPLSYQLQQGAEQQWLPTYQPIQPNQQQQATGIGYQPLQEQQPPPGPRQYHRSYYHGEGQTASATSDSSSQQQQQQQPPPP